MTNALPNPLVISSPATVFKSTPKGRAVDLFKTALTVRDSTSLDNIPVEAIHLSLISQARANVKDLRGLAYSADLLEVFPVTTRRDREILEIARGKLGLETLDVRNSESLDFHALGVGSIADALKAAFEAGKEAGQ